MLSTYQAPSKVYGSVYGGYAQSQVVQPQVVQPQVIQPQVLQPQVMAPTMMQPGLMPQMPRPFSSVMPAMTDYPFTGMQVTGGLQIALGILAIGLGIAGAILDPMEINGLLGIFGMCSIFLTGLLSVVTGCMGILQSRQVGNVEAYRNSYMVLGAIVAILCLAAVVEFSLFLFAVNAAGVFGNTPVGETYNAIFITLLVVTACEGLVALIGASMSCCCAPFCCTPLVEQGEYSYQYRKEAPVMGFGRPQMY